MAKGNPNPKNQFSSTNQPINRGNGETKSKLRSLIVDRGLSANDISKLICTIFDNTEDELKETIEDKEKPFLIRAFARAFFDDVQGGKLTNINTMLDRAVGKVTDKTDIKHTTLNEDGEEVGMNINIEFTGD